ncbi:MAG: NAD(P) transhydrogenase subunit alpha [Opitutales bacterium]|nr:NAD(P) transhydrogenase subunit alpha [Opitutales bacterium]MCH8539693.1 NAD(P) transhydrogenase subunit alpha [Opitutales bacterium]
MHCFTYREDPDQEPRVALTPGTAARLKRLGCALYAPTGVGSQSHFPDEQYVGVTFLQSTTPPPEARILLKIQPPTPDEIAGMPKGATLLSLLDPFRRKELLPLLAERNINAICLEMIPRSTLAQKMDVLSSQANLAGYAAVLQAAREIPTILPMMTTPAGTLQPARVFVIGAGVAGLQAIATAKRLGARVEAFDTRPVVEEQVKSLGAKFVKIDLGNTGQTHQGYAKELTEEQISRQREGMKKICGQSQIVITTAKLFGRPSPILVTSEMIAAMQPGSVIVDLAAETGGNVEGSRPNENVRTANGVLICGTTALERTVPQHASEMFASNVAHFLEHFWNTETQSLELPEDDEIIRATVLTKNGQVVHPAFST